MRIATVFVLAGLLTLPTMVSADKGGRGHKQHGKGQGQAGHGPDAMVTVKVGFSVVQRDAVRAWYGESYGRGKCPPGLAKKRNGCLPPGQAKKRYTIGLPLPPGLPRLPPPPALLMRIGPPPPGFQFIMLDGDLVQLAVGTALVVDAVQGLVE